MMTLVGVDDASCDHEQGASAPVQWSSCRNQGHSHLARYLLQVSCTEVFVLEVS